MIRQCFFSRFSLFGWIKGHGMMMMIVMVMMTLRKTSFTQFITVVSGLRFL